MSYPRISIRGSSSRERGRQYGELAREQVHACIETYGEIFARWAHWDRDRVHTEAEAFRAPIANYNQKYLDEMTGIAEGAGVPEIDVLAINVRTELMFAAKARDAEALSGRQPPAECSSFAVLPNRSSDAHTLIGQNWDWLEPSRDAVVVLEVEQDDAPNYVTVVEAGLLAKLGMNSAGVGLGVNQITTDLDQGKPGVPFHVLLRAVLDCRTVSDALGAMHGHERSSSGNFLLAHADGLALDVEASAGGIDDVWLVQPQAGVIAHTNHFVNERFNRRDVSLYLAPDSPFRLQRMRHLFDELEDTQIDPVALQRILSDHAGFTHSICYHPDPACEPLDTGATLAGVVMDLNTRTIWLASGNPCMAPFEEIDCSALLMERSELDFEPVA